MYGATAGQVGILKLEAATNQAICGILPGKHFFPEFLYYFLLSRRDELVAQAAGNAQPNISQFKIKNTLAPIVPISEQKRVVGVLGEAFESIAAARTNAKQNCQNARILFESHLQAAFSQRDEGWLEKKLGDLIATNVIGLNRNSGQQGVDKAWPYLKMSNITRDNRLDLSSCSTIDASPEDVRKFRLRRGDFLFNTRNSSELVGKSCIYEAVQDDVVLYNNNIMRIRFVAGIDAWFVLLAFSYRPVAKALTALKNGTTNVSAIYFKDLSSLAVPIPPLSVQQKMVAQLARLRAETQRLEALYRRKVTALEGLKKSLLHQAFTGQV
jgi:type I restriction enzyme S subunit